MRKHFTDISGETLNITSVCAAGSSDASVLIDAISGNFSASFVFDGPTAHAMGEWLIAAADEMEGKNTRTNQELAKKAIDAVVSLISESRGVAGLHLNGDVATWDELLAGGYMEEWLLPLSNYVAAADEMAKEEEK
jgi:hypothetical protein